MNTPAHLLIGMAVFGRKSGTRRASALGAVAPDLSLYLMAGAALFVLRIPPNIVFGELYFSPAWQTVFAIDNSFPLWTALLCAAIWWRRPWAIALCGAALLHLALDFPLHHDDGRPHFWPFSGWVFQSPLSYWDRAPGRELDRPIGGIGLCRCRDFAAAGAASMAYSPIGHRRLCGGTLDRAHVAFRFRHVTNEKPRQLWWRGFL